MTSSVKKVASIALPIIGTLVAPGIGTALGSTLGSAALAGIGGALGGAAGGLVSGGGAKGALIGGALGGVGGYAAGGGLGYAAGTPLATTTGNAALQGPTIGTGLIGGISRSGVGQALSGALSSPASLALGAGNIFNTLNQAEAAEEAARIQAAAAGQANQQFRADTAPYRQFGEQAIGEINQINADPASYIQNDQLYSSLADDAERRLLANQAAKGKVGSGGTAAALQQQLLNLGSGLVQNRLNTLQGQVNTGANTAVGAGSRSADLTVQQGNAQAAGSVGQANAFSGGYQNQLNTLLALQSLNKAPTYQPVNA